MKTLFIYLSLFLFFFSTSIFSQWYQQYSGVNTNLYSFFSIDGQTAWTTGANGVILKTTNSGASWIQKNSGLSCQTFLYIYFFDENEGIVTGTNGPIRKND